MEKQHDLFESSGNLFHESPEIIDLDDDDEDNDDSFIKIIKNKEPDYSKTNKLFVEKPTCSKTIESISKESINKEVPQPLKKEVTSLEHVKNDVTADITNEFLEIAIQQVLYHRGLYPKEIFRNFKKYHVSIYISAFPDLLDYIVNILQPLKPLIKQDRVKQIVLSIMQNDKLYEEFVFELMSDRKSVSKRDEEHLEDLELSLRECLLRIATYDAPPPEDPENCSFEIKAHVEKSSALQLLHDDNENSKIQWIKHDTDDADVVTERRLDPLKTIKDSPYMKMQLFVLRG